jgi:osmotically-inducible protein OsmY
VTVNSQEEIKTMPSLRSPFGPSRLPLAALALVAAVTVGCASTQSPGTQLEDTAIKTDVLARITADPDLNPFEISVDVNEGVVYLSGVVDERSDAQEAARVARRASGVRNVVNNIRVGDQTAGERLDDGTITARVKAKLASEMNPFNINVTTTDGVVQLIGRVPTAGDRSRAEDLARSVDGVRGVQNELEVGDIG